MGQTSEYWADVKESQKIERRLRAEEANKNFPRLSTTCSALGLKAIVKSDTHWIITFNMKTVIQYWPSTRKMQVTKNGKVSHCVTVEMLEERIIRGRY